ncbi:ElyC/SanA/YdcF family protein [Micromonospora chalcea]
MLTSGDYQTLAGIMEARHGEVSPTSPVDLLIVFCCADPEVGRTAAALHGDGLVHRTVFSGGVGKDAGGLPALGISEAVFQASVAVADGLPTEVVLLEQKARNGAENAALSLRLAAARGWLTQGARVASLAPAQRCRRLYEELRYQVDTGYPAVGTVSALASGTVDPDDPQTRVELQQEIRGLSTMHLLAAPRIHRLDEFQPGGIHHELTRKVARQVF